MTRLQEIFSPHTVLLGTIVILIGVPVVTVLAHLFVPSSGVWPHLTSTVLPGYVANSLWLMAGVGVGTLVVGTATAWLIVMTEFPGRRLLEWLLILPLAAPAYVIAYAYTDFLQVSGPVQGLLRDVTGWTAQDYSFPPIRSLGGAILVFIFALYPYVYLAARAAFLQQCESAVEAARTLGCTAWTSFRRVALPMARPALAAGVTLALMETLADFGAVSYFGVQTFTTGIYRTWFSFGDRVAAAQLASLLLAFIAVLLLSERRSRRGARYDHGRTQMRAQAVTRLVGARAWLAQAACALPVIFGFALPAAILMGLLLELEGAATRGYVALIGNSVTLAGITAVLAVLLALAIVYALRLGGGAAVSFAARLAAMGYAIPGSIIAVGVLIPFAAFDSALDGFMRQTFGVSTGLLLSGGIVALVFAYLVRFLAVSQQTLQAGMDRITPSIEAAAATLGASRLRILARVHAPMLRGSLLTAFLLVFVEVMKELPATLIMRPFNFDTLAVRAHNLAADERLAEAALPALSIVIAGLVPVYILSRLIAASRPGAGAAQDTVTPPSADGPIAARAAAEA